MLMTIRNIQLLLLGTSVGNRQLGMTGLTVYGRAPLNHLLWL